MNIANSKSLQIVAISAMLLLAAGCGQRVDLGPVPNSQAAKEIRAAFVSTTEAGAGGGAAAAPTGTGWGTLRGRFVFDGDAPTMPPYNVTKDQATCAPGGNAPPQEWLLVDSSGGIQNVVVFLREASRVHDSAKPGVDSVLFDQKICVFLTHVCALTVGQTLDIKNSDNVGHNTNIAGARNKFNQTIPAGESIAYKIQKEEALPAPVNCSIHPWMIAYLLPRENGYVAVSKEDGTFEITNLPAGEELEIQVWHESATGSGGALVVTTPEAKSLGWTNRGRFTLTLQPDETKEVDIKVPASAFKG